MHLPSQPTVNKLKKNRTSGFNIPANDWIVDLNIAFAFDNHQFKLSCLASFLWEDSKKYQISVITHHGNSWRTSIETISSCIVGPKKWKLRIKSKAIVKSDQHPQPPPTPPRYRHQTHWRNQHLRPTMMWMYSKMNVHPNLCRGRYFSITCWMKIKIIIACHHRQIQNQKQHHQLLHNLLVQSQNRQHSHHLLNVNL